MRDVKVRLNPNAFKQGAKTDELSRDIHVISEEIQSYKQRVSSSIIEIGKRLRHVKEHDLARGRWLDWLASLQIEARQAQRFMQAYEQFGNTSASTLLESGKIIEMLTLPPEVDRAEFIGKKHRVPSTGEEKTVGEMSTREIREVVKEERRAAGLVKDKEPSSPVPSSRKGNVKEVQTFVEAVERLHPDIRWAVFNCSVTIKQAISISTLPGYQQMEFNEVLMSGYEKFNVRFYEIFRAISKDYKKETVNRAMRLLEKILASLLFIGGGLSAAGMESSILKMMKDDSTTEQTFLSCLEEYEARIEEGESKWRRGHEEASRGWQEQFREMFGKIPQKPVSDSPYKVLGLKESAPFEEVRTRYRSLMQVIHPDKGGSDYLFQSVKAAYEEIRATNKVAV